MKTGLLIAAPNSGSGKTVLTLGLLRALKSKGLDICGAKAGPDFIDPAFHEVACGSPSVNLDPWAMSDVRLRQLAGRQPRKSVLVEGMMGLFDGAADGSGSAADLAASLKLPVLLVVDCAKQSHSIAALVRGFVMHRPDLEFSGVILNRVGSSRHEAMLRDAVEPLGVRVLGAVPRSKTLVLPERHLGLVQASEHTGLEDFIGQAAELMEKHVDLAGLAEAFGMVANEDHIGEPDLIPAPGKRIAVARDDAFRFMYPHHVADWKRQGSEISWFSPLADEAPVADADYIYLPGGYPELHAGRLSGASAFRDGMRKAAAAGVPIYGECGGYMVLGNGLVDAEGKEHRMCGLLDLVTSFETRKLSLGYRRIKRVLEPQGNARRAAIWSAHEFHYSSALRERGNRLFEAEDARGSSLGSMGLKEGSVSGSYLHLIDPLEGEVGS